MGNHEHQRPACFLHGSVPNTAHASRPLVRTASAGSLGCSRGIVKQPTGVKLDFNHHQTVSLGVGSQTVATTPVTPVPPVPALFVLNQGNPAFTSGMAVHRSMSTGALRPSVGNQQSGQQVSTRRLLSPTARTFALGRGV